MTSIFTAWRRRSDPERFDTYTRWSLYLIMGIVPLVVLGVMPAGLTHAPAVAALYLVAMLVECVLAIAVLRRSIDRALGGVPVPRRGLVLLAPVAVLAAALAVAALPAEGAPGLAGRAGAVAAALGAALLAVAPVLRTGAILTASLVAAVAAGFAEQTPPGVERFVPTVVSAFLIVGGLAVSFRASAWMLGVVWEQERARAVHARLAVAEERLRFSRDLHDVVGRTLSAIAVKSELGAELARRGHDGAAEQMLEVRELAAEALREVRGVVAGYRTTDLAAELAGARSVLRSAGVGTRVLGDGARLAPDVQQTLAWVVREGATNVVRHARATACTLDLEVLPAGGGAVARLRIVNDGATPARGESGSGLLGLAERLDQVGGALTTSRDGDVFTLEATVPLGLALGDAGPPAQVAGAAVEPGPGPAHSPGTMGPR
ncbi:sensor histidine kinase [Georgenia sp. SYP-B2076]|uniref:sensor histidine kinase n=1 Tax=Georgenia sp. SYP-B2076 TaxID=2495881 RepID=UPI000F8CC14B|nr:histidine kinase [Georgenia sp. SYP-B2076]